MKEALLLVPLALGAVLVKLSLDLNSERTVESAPLEKQRGAVIPEHVLVEDLDLYDVLALDPSESLIVEHSIRVIDSHGVSFASGVLWEFTVIAKVRKLTWLDKLQRKGGAK